MQKTNTMPDQLNLFQRIRYSILPGTLQKPKNKDTYRVFFNSLMLHFRPRNVSQRTLRFTLTWGLGGMAVMLVGLLFGSGLMLKFVYQPVPDRAYASIVHLQQYIFFGQLIRNVHHWSGNTLLIVVFLHFLRVFFTGAFHPPRQFNWILGLVMFLAYYLRKTRKEGELEYEIFNAIKLVEWDTLLFFFVVMFSVGGLAFIGYLGIASATMYGQWGATTANVLLGAASAIIDNIPIMFSVLSMNPEMPHFQWLLVTLTCGVGGSLLAIGSAAGVALLGAAKGQYTFASHLKWTPVIALGYAAGIGAHFLVNG